MLKPGTIVTKLNDIPLRGEPLDVWSKTLLEENALTTQDAGFCIPNKLLFSKQDCLQWEIIRFMRTTSVLASNA